jgi:CTP synthase
VPVECVFGLADHNPVYNVPLELYDSGFNTAICKRLGLCDETPDAPCGVADLSDWREYVARSRGRHSLPRVQIALVAKYQHADAYKSVLEALEHAGLSVGVRVDVTVCDAEMFDGSEKDAETLREFDGVLVPGGFGARGVAGKIAACRAARENDIPYFGICLGLQIAVIEAARNLCGYADADSTEFAPDTEHPVVAILENQKGVSNTGGTMRLGNCPTRPIMGTRLAEAYCTELGESVTERHRHRFEINGAYLEDLYRVGMCLCATGRDGLAEAMERVGHPWFIGVQYHPEFNSRPTAPHPLFVAFVRAGKKRADGRPPAAPSNREFVIRVRQNEMRVVSGKVPEGSIFAGLQGDSK